MKIKNLFLILVGVSISTILATSSAAQLPTVAMYVVRLPWYQANFKQEQFYSPRFTKCNYTDKTHSLSCHRLAEDAIPTKKVWDFAFTSTGKRHLCAFVDKNDLVTDITVFTNDEMKTFISTASTNYPQLETVYVLKYRPTPGLKFMGESKNPATKNYKSQESKYYDKTTPEKIAKEMQK